jgi:curved DNA-binding protein CbpA
MPDFYNVLGVPRSASHEEIRAAYKDLSLRYHPDRPGGNEETFKKIQEAHEVLTNRNRKAVYNGTGSTAAAAAAGSEEDLFGAAAASAAGRAAKEERRGRTVDPERIATLAQWAKAYGKFKNVRIGADGIPTVFTRESAANQEPSIAKQFPSEKAHDLYVVLQSGESELRETALGRLEELVEGLVEPVGSATAAYRGAEKAFLEATDRWRSATTPFARQLAAEEAARASAAAAAAEGVLRQTETPRRTTVWKATMTRNEVDYRTGDGRVHPPFKLLVPRRFDASDRIVTEADTA